jgi:hypothetical protein
VTASEFAFLSLGLLLGVLSGAALVEVVRSRPPSPRQIRLTVTPDSVPRRRAATLAEDAFILPGPEPAHGGPGDRRNLERETDEDLPPRTLVPSLLGPAGAGDLTSNLPPSRLANGSGGGPGGQVARPPGMSISAAVGAIAVPIHREADSTLAALRNAAAQVAERAIRDQRMTAAAILDRPTAKAGRVNEAMPSAEGPAAARADDPGGAGGATTPMPPGAAAPTTGGDDRCADVARVAEERCNVATLAKSQAEAAQEALRAAQRAYDDHLTRAEKAGVAADPRAIRVAKEAAQHAFREARGGASTPESVEAAARDWLTEINRINKAARDATAIIQREHEEATALVNRLERLTVEADAARIGAESAAAACLAARQAVADCQEAAAADRSTRQWPVAPSGEGTGDPSWGDESELEAAFTATGAGEPAILKLLRGDRATLGRLVAQLAGDDPAERRRWQLALAGLVDAIVARSIEAATLTFPEEHPFWGMFTRSQSRDVVGALSSLGFRFDGLGGWADERVPTQRDLSLAVGYAGIDPMRVRPWPTEEELAQLFTGVAVAADEYLADAAGGLTLGELVSLLGRRADGLAELWNEWGRVRPALLAGG